MLRFFTALGQSVHFDIRIDNVLCFDVLEYRRTRKEETDPEAKFRGQCISYDHQCRRGHGNGMTIDGYHEG